MDTKKAILITKIVCGAVSIGAVIYDIIILVVNPAGTISNVSLTLSYKFAFIPFTFGFICGHVFWPGKKAKGLIGIIAGIVIAIGLSILQHYIKINPGVYLLLGIPLGHLLWTQKKKEV
jgi:Na+/proline symporter